ncbi:MAG TPA: hypothetical protein DHV04_03880 [Flavobacteriaceae bacterium]|jgi:hypothetical protein|nr:hypothetical protein [Flavobacteriaceae bacterium]
MDSYRETLSDIDLKNKLLKQLIVTIEEDINQLQVVKEKLDFCLDASEILLTDHLSTSDKIKKDTLVKYYSDLRYMNLSFFPQYGVYNQLLSSNGLENIEDEILRDKLVYTYENLMKRTAAADPILDEIRWKSFMSLSQQIVVISSREEPIDPDSNLPLFSHKVDQYFISENYYKSKEVLSFYNQVMVYINQYKSGLANILIAFEDIVALAQVEVGSND